MCGTWPKVNERKKRGKSIQYLRHCFVWYNKIRVMEQNKTIEDQTKSMGKLEKNKVKVEKRLSTVKTELQNQEYRARDELQQAQKLLHSQANAMAELTHRQKKVVNSNYYSYSLNESSFCMNSECMYPNFSHCLMTALALFCVTAAGFLYCCCSDVRGDNASLHSQL